MHSRMTLKFDDFRISTTKFNIFSIAIFEPPGASTKISFLKGKETTLLFPPGCLSHSFWARPRQNQTNMVGQKRRWRAREGEMNKNMVRREKIKKKKERKK